MRQNLREAGGVHLSAFMDLRYALRSIRKDPSFTLLAILVLALGIGANTAVFSVVDAVLLKPLAYKDADRIVVLNSLFKKTGGKGHVSAPDYYDWHDQSSAFAAMAYYNGGETAVATPNGGEYIVVNQVTPEFFDVFQVQPAAGRLLTADDRKAGTNVVIGYNYALAHFPNAAAALGSTVRMNSATFTVVGVAQPGFGFPEKTQIWMSANALYPETTSRSAHNYNVIARLKPGVTLDEAQTQMTTIGTRLSQQYSDDRLKNVAVTQLQDRMVTNIRLTLYLLLGAVALVLLIACANTANLLLAKATARTREMAIRAAVGASRGRIIRQLFTESLVLAIASAAVGLSLASFGCRALVALAPANLPRVGEVSIDGRVLAFTLLLSVASTLLFGLAPAFQASRTDLNASLKQGGGRTNIAGSNGLRSVLVVAEVAFSVVLLAGAGLLIRSFNALSNVELGFRPEHVLVMETEIPAMDRAGSLRAVQVFRGLLSETAALPGVVASGVTLMPPGNSGSDGGYFVDRLPDFKEPNSPQALFSLVSPGVFATLGLQLKAGRDFTGADTYEAPFTAIVNEAFVKQSFPHANPIGHIVYCGFDSDKPMTVVGVVSDFHQLGPAVPPQPELYMSYQQHPRNHLYLMARTASEPAALSETLRRMVHARSPEASAKFSTLQLRVEENVAAPRFRMLLLGIFAGLALCLAMAGVYGVMSYAVGQRSGEIGVRMALGAGRASVLGLVLMQALKLIAIGLAFGLAAAFVASRLLTSMLFEVKPADPVTYVAVAGALGLIGLLASYFPALRATRVDPLTALRQE
ncbi:MAG TPA: ABC transporter permease [Candidatus Limnocylindrales bacterium]|nr:ABC transporter permease [Candidatus Limnocylindrales bacterium]